LVIVLGLSWLLFCVPVLAFHGVIPGANLPVEVFALASTLLILLPTALWVTSITDGRAGVRALFARVFRWRFGIGWWLVVLFGLPVIALLLGLIFGGSLHTADLGQVLIKQLGSIVLAVVVINLWEETVWAGFFQTRLEARFNFVVAAVLTALPFAAVHVPLLLLDDQVSVLSVLMGIAGLLILGIVVRLLMGVIMRAALDSVLTRWFTWPRFLIPPHPGSGCCRPTWWVPTRSQRPQPIAVSVGWYLPVACTPSPLCLPKRR
jgi:membrane protease YdiL (CAAX protease family)